jgi:hypothetical protein
MNWKYKHWKLIDMIDHLPHYSKVKTWFPAMTPAGKTNGSWGADLHESHDANINHKHAKIEIVTCIAWDLSSLSSVDQFCSTSQQHVIKENRNSNTSLVRWMGVGSLFRTLEECRQDTVLDDLCFSNSALLSLLHMNRHAQPAFIHTYLHSGEEAGRVGERWKEGWYYSSVWTRRYITVI